MAITAVTSEIKKILKEQKLGVISGTEAIRKLLEELQRQVHFGIAMAAPGWDIYHLKKLMTAIEFQIDNFDAKAKAEISGQIEKSWGWGQALVDLPLKVAGIYAGYPFLSTSVLDTLKNFAFHRIENLSDDAWLKIKGELTMGLTGGKTPGEVTQAIGGNIDKGRFASISERAEVITKTEMSKAFNDAAEKRFRLAGQYVDGLENQWLHAGHPVKARPTHLAANGVHVAVDKPFPVIDKNGYALMKPYDPKADVSEIINCG